MGLRIAYRLGGGILKLSYGGSKPKRDGTIFIGEVDLPHPLPSKTPSKDFNLAIAGGASLDKMVKNGAGESLYFMQVFLHYILSGEHFIG